MTSQDDNNGNAGDVPDPKPPHEVGPSEFARLFEENRDRFVRLAHAIRRRPGGDASLETMDYVQDASCEFLKKPRDVKSESHFVQLFKGFLVNSFRGKRRDAKAQKRGGGAAPGSLPTTLGVAQDAQGPLTVAARHESEDLLLARLASLDPLERRLITMRLWDERSWEELATELELASPEAARKRYARALERLQDE
ncbi:MAG: sigma-70 family RNA polymerase sigma factor [Planctomycetes bacterium]|nr:sigma-70 family RNA polymerase sigma factor [Planctomycetota bacterium]